MSKYRRSAPWPEGWFLSGSGANAMCAVRVVLHGVRVADGSHRTLHKLLRLPDEFVAHDGMEHVVRTGIMLDTLLAVSDINDPRRTITVPLPFPTSNEVALLLATLRDGGTDDVYSECVFCHAPKLLLHLDDAVMDFHVSPWCDDCREREVVALPVVDFDEWRQRLRRRPCECAEHADDERWCFRNALEGLSRAYPQAIVA